MRLPHPLTRDVVLIGGGHTHALVLRMWGMRKLPGARLTVVNPSPTATYTGMLPGHIAGHYSRDELDIDVMRLCQFAGARLVIGVVTAINADEKVVTINGERDLEYDIASIDIGITSELPEVEGFSEFAAAAKPLGPYANRWAEFVATGGGPVAVIGGGLGGIELAMAMAHALRSTASHTPVTLIEADRIADELPARANALLRQKLDAYGIRVLERSQVRAIEATQVVLVDGKRIPASLTVTASGARPWSWLKRTGLHLTNGYVTVREDLRSVSHPDVYASGDCAHFSHAPRPKAGVYAVRAAPILFHNLRADLVGSARKRFRPQRTYLKLVSLGEKSALALRSGLHASGPAMWTLKDRIDRRFMTKLLDLPTMEPPPLPTPHARGLGELDNARHELCGGCGAKVGRQSLDLATKNLPKTREDIETAAGDDAAVLRVGGQRQVLTTDHLRAFIQDPALMARISALHALGDIWAMGAVPQASLCSITLPPMSPRLQDRTLSEIMESAAAVFSDSGADIVGGHTTQGAELTIGFTVTGLLDKPPIGLGGARDGDALILTRPIGTGVLLAGQMALKARGNDVAHMLDTMATSQAEVAQILGCANAMTDITGFGLAGHLSAILEASGQGAEIDIGAIAFYQGARELAQAGVRSTLFPQNRAATQVLNLPDTPEAELLFDPQTAGGFLAAVPQERAREAIEKTRAIGCMASQIGRVTTGLQGLRIV